MAKERCLKKSFQDSLEDIKERMKEKRNKKLAKVTTVNKALSTKAKIINNTQTTATLKSFQANNKALALALDAEKIKTRQAQDLILHLKSEHQRLTLEIFLLKRQLNRQQESSQADARLSSLKDIIAKVTQNLLETANLLGPAHALCSSNHESLGIPHSVDEKCSTPAGTSNRVKQTHNPPAAYVTMDNSMLARSYFPERRNPKEVALEKCDNGPAVKRLSRGRKSSLNRRVSEDENSDTEAVEDTSYLKNVSVRRRASSLNVCVEEFSMKNGGLNSMIEAPKPEDICLEMDSLEESADCKVVDLYPYQTPSNYEIVPFIEGSEISSSTPEPKPKQVSKAKNESRPGQERVRRSKTDGMGNAQLKKPWEKPKPRARSKSRERAASKPAVSKDKLNRSLNSGDSYDFFCEESIHVTPFRQKQQNSNPEENKDSEEENVDKSSSNSSSSSSSSDELNDSLYLPSKEKSRSRGAEQVIAALPLRSRSKRSKAQQQQVAENLEKRASDKLKQDVVKGKKTPKTCRKGVKTEIVFNEATENGESNKENSLLKCAAKEFEQALDNNGAGDHFIFPADRSTYQCEGPPQRISLLDVTNFSSCSGSNDAKKHSFPFVDSERKRSETGLRKRRCSAMVNYAEPSLIKKLRRGDPFTDTKFLSSPIFKSREQPNRKTLSRKSLARYNEAFVGCGS